MACAGSDCDYVDAGSGSESGLDGFRPLPPPHPLVVGFIATQSLPQGAESLPPPSTCSKAGRNHLNKEITPLLPTGIGEKCNQTISNLRRAALLRRCELPL